MKKIILLLLLVLVAVFSGCIKYDEELWIEADGSGKVTMKLGLPDMGMGDMQQTSNFQEKPGVKLISEKTYKEEDSMIYEYQFEFDFVDSLSNLEDGDGQDVSGFIGDIEFYIDGNDNLIFNRVIAFKKSEEETEEDENDEMGDQMFDSMFSQFSWTYTVHFPFEIVNANTPEPNIDRKTNTVKWVFPLSKLQDDQTMTATMKHGGGGSKLNIVNIIIAGAIVLVLIIGVVALVIMKNK